MAFFQALCSVPGGCLRPTICQKFLRLMPHAEGPLKPRCPKSFVAKNTRFCAIVDRFWRQFRSFWYLSSIATSNETPQEAARAPKAPPGPKKYGFGVIFGQKGAPLGGSLGSFWRLFFATGVSWSTKQIAFKIKTDFASILWSPRRGSGGFLLQRQLDSHIFSRTPKSSIVASIFEMF